MASTKKDIFFPLFNRNNLVSRWSDFQRSATCLVKGGNTGRLDRFVNLFKFHELLLSTSYSFTLPTEYESKKKKKKISLSWTRLSFCRPSIMAQFWMKMEQMLQFSIIHVTKMETVVLNLDQKIKWK